MTILVTGATGRIGSHVVAQLAAQGADVRAITRQPEKATFPAGVAVAQGDPLDVAAMRAALDGVSTLFLLVGNVADEMTQAVNTLNLAREAGVRGIVYVSVTRSDAYVDVPHFASKHVVERMIERLALPATVLRPSYFFQNDLTLQEPLTRAGLYVSPVGEIGVSMVDVRDIADVAVAELLRRERAPAALPRETWELSGPDALTGSGLATIWSTALGRDVRYAAGDLAAFEQALQGRAPGWLAFELRAMMARYQADGAVATADDIERLTALLGRPPRRYADFAREAAAGWQA